MAEIITQEQKLKELEGKIEAGFQRFYEAGLALQEIQEEKLYQLQYKTFDDYCFDRWGIKRSRVYQLIDHAGTIKEMSTMVDILPENERQTRPLKDLPPPQQSQAWQQAQQDTGSNQPPAKAVQQAANDFRPVPKSYSTRGKGSKVTITNQGKQQAPGIDAEFEGDGTQDETAMAETLESKGWTVIPPNPAGHNCPYCGKKYQP